jgi:DNA-binding response OmpR family regulator
MQLQPPDSPRILVAEHDQSVAELLFAFLRGEGYNVSIAPSMESALAQMDEQTFHVALTDLFAENARRPLSQARRLLLHAPPTPVGLMTGWQVPPQEVRRQGFAFLIAKPFDLDLLLTEVAACLRQPLTPEQDQQLQLLERLTEALRTHNLETLSQILTEDITYYPSARALSSISARVQGLPAILAYVQASYSRYQNVAFDKPLFYLRPKGWAMRYASHWFLPDGSRQSLTGVLLFHFQGTKIHQMGIQLDGERWQGLLKS